MKTRRGIYENIEESDYYLEIDNFVLFFSSNFYKKKYAESLKRYIFEETEKVNKKFKCKCNFNILFIIALYRKIEKRGFRIYYNNKRLNLKKLRFYVTFYSGVIA